MLYTPVVDYFRRPRLVAILMTLIVGCYADSSYADSVPTVDAARNAFLKEQSKGYSLTWNDLIDAGVVKLNRFEKINGVASVIFGRQMYRLDYRAELEVMESFAVVSRSRGHGEGWVPQIVKLSERPKSPLQSFPKGTLFHEEGGIVFGMTENGWIAGG